MRLPSGSRHRVAWLILFSVAMAQLEAAVVVYLRQLYYPEGFRFPLVVITGRMAWVEIGREAATLLMLVAVGRLAARDPWRRFAAFLLAFGVWDLFYYLWLWILLGWPPSLMTWDILFLIPLPWVGPVLSAALVALLMVLAGLAIEGLREAGRTPRVGRWGWAGVVAGSLGLLVLWMRDARGILAGELPRPFPWGLYALFLALPVVAALQGALRASRAPSKAPGGDAEGISIL